MQNQDQNPKILEQVHSVMRLHHYSIHTERTYIDWIKRYVGFHQMKLRDDLADGERKIEAFLTHLAVDGNVAPSTQNHRVKGFAPRGQFKGKQPCSTCMSCIRRMIMGSIWIHRQSPSPAC